MEQLLDDDHLKSQHQGKGSRLRVKRNYDRNSLLLHSSKLHKLSKKLFQLKVVKSNNRTTAQFFSTTCYRRLKIPKRRRQFNVIRFAILFLLLFFVYLYWRHRTLLVGNESTGEYLDKNYRTGEQADSYLASTNLKQIDEKQTNDREDDQKDRANELQHLFSASTNNDRSSLKLDFNTRHKSELHALNPTTVSRQKTDETIEHINKEIKNEKIQNYDHTRRTSSVSSTSLLVPARRTNVSILHPPFKDYSFLSRATTNPLVSKSNQSISISASFPVEQRKNSKSILEKQLAWYELVGMTMFNLLGSSLAGQNSNISNKKFKNHSNNSNAATTTKIQIQSNVETTLLKPISSSIRLSSTNHSSIHANPTTGNRALGLIKNLPQCIIIGVRKAGTRAVLEYLTLNDRIRRADNEVHFFDNDERYALGLEFYRNQMPLSAQGQITIEKSPAYFVTVPSVPERISKSMNKTIKLILIVRDPVVRLISDYTQLISKQLAHNKLLKLDDLIRTSGSSSTKQQHLQAKQMENHLFEFPVDRQKKNEKQKNSYTRLTASGVATNEQSAFVVAEEQAKHYNLEEKKIEKVTDEYIATNYPSTLAFDYSNRIGSEPDYRKEEQIDEELDEEQEDDTFVSLPIVKRQIPNGDSSNKMNKPSNCSTISNEPKNQRVVKSIAFGETNENSKIIDLTATATTLWPKRKLKNNQNRKRSILRCVKSINKITRRTKRKINSKDRKSSVRRLGREADDEDKFYKSYKTLNRDDEDSELEDDYLSEERMKAAEQRARKYQTTTEQVMTNQEEDYHNLRIPRFEELVIRNGEVNTNYKPVKTSIYSLYMDSWLHVFRRDQIIIVDGDRLIKEPHVELNKIETFLGLPNQINRSQFVFNKKKNFYCARMTSQFKQFKHRLNGNSSTAWLAGWPHDSKLATNRKKPNKTTGRHSSIRCLNSSKGRKHPQVDKQVISKLRQFYAPFNRHFENLVGIKFNWPEF